MQYAIMSGRTPELLAGITFYSIYSHLNWVETLMRQWCTAIESCLPPGWLPRAVQNVEWKWKQVFCGWRKVCKMWEKCSSCAPPCFLSGSTRTQQQRWRPAEWSSLVRNADATASWGDTCWDLRANMHKLLQIRGVGRSRAACMLMRTPCS